MRHIIPCLLVMPALVACNSKTDERLKAIEGRLAMIEQSIAEHRAITLRPGDTGYGLLETDFGRIAVALADIQPYANGSRIILDFGNPTMARLSGMKADIEWGSNDAKGLPMTGDRKSFAFTAPQPLLPGSWRQYVIDLADVPPAKLGWVRVSGFDSGTVDLLSQ